MNKAIKLVMTGVGKYAGTGNGQHTAVRSRYFG